MDAHQVEPTSTNSQVEPFDNLFRVEVIQATPNPQQVIYAALHQDYCEDFVWDKTAFPPEEKCGEIIVKQLLAGDRGHYGPLEHPQITLACGYFPHSVMQQARTHRVGISFDVQSSRYTGLRVVEAAEGKREIEDVFYLRPVGDYGDRQGKKYHYSAEQRQRDLNWCLLAAKQYKEDLEAGMSEEHARGKLPFDYRQHFIVSFNTRSLMHFCDLRLPKNAQLEVRILAELLFEKFKEWVPQVAEWYEKHRYRKPKLAP